MAKCNHEKLDFGSGAFYIFCSYCNAVWVAKKPKSNDEEIDYSRGSDDIGEYDYRVLPK